MRLNDFKEECIKGFEDTNRVSDSYRMLGDISDYLSDSQLISIMKIAEYLEITLDEAHKLVGELYRENHSETNLDTHLAVLELEALFQKSNKQ